MKRFVMGMSVLLASALAGLPATAEAQQKLVVKSLAEKKVTELPAGSLIWRIERFPTRAQAEAAAGPWSLAAESAGKVWLFTLGSDGGSAARSLESRRSASIRAAWCPRTFSN